MEETDEGAVRRCIVNHLHEHADMLEYDCGKGCVRDVDMEEQFDN